MAVTLRPSRNNVHSFIETRRALADITRNIENINAMIGGGGGGGIADAQYLTLATDTNLTNERVFTPGTGLTGTDAGVGSTYTLDWAADIEDLDNVNTAGVSANDILVYSGSAWVDSNTASLQRITLTTADAAANVTCVHSSAIAGNRPRIAMQRSRSGPAAVQLDDWLAVIGISGHDGNDFESAAAIRVLADENWGIGSNGARMEFVVVESGTTTGNVAVRLNNDGTVEIPDLSGTGTENVAADANGVLVRGTGSSIDLGDLGDVDVAGAADGSLLQLVSGTWEDRTPAQVAGSIFVNDLSDVDTTGVAAGDFLKFNGATWVDNDLFNTDNTWEIIQLFAGGFSVTSTTEGLNTIATDVYLNIGTTSATALRFLNATVDHLQLMMKTGTASFGGYVTLIDRDDRADTNVHPASATSNPTLRIYQSGAAASDDYFDLFFDGDANISQGSGDLKLTPTVDISESSTSFTAISFSGSSNSGSIIWDDNNARLQLTDDVVMGGLEILTTGLGDVELSSTGDLTLTSGGADIFINDNTDFQGNFLYLNTSSNYIQCSGAGLISIVATSCIFTGSGLFSLAGATSTVLGSTSSSSPTTINCGTTNGTITLRQGTSTTWQSSTGRHWIPGADWAYNVGSSSRRTWLYGNRIGPNRTITSDDDAETTDDVVFIDAGSGNVTLTLLAASGNDGRYITVKSIDATNTCTVSANGTDAIDGSGSPGSFTLAVNESRILYCDGSEWKNIAEYTP